MNTSTYLSQHTTFVDAAIIIFKNAYNVLRLKQADFPCTLSGNELTLVMADIITLLKMEGFTVDVFVLNEMMTIRKYPFIEEKLV